MPSFSYFNLEGETFVFLCLHFRSHGHGNDRSRWCWLANFFPPICGSCLSRCVVLTVTHSLSFNSYSRRVSSSGISSGKLRSCRTNLYAVVETTAWKHWSIAPFIVDSFSMSSTGQVDWSNSLLCCVGYSTTYNKLEPFLFNRTTHYFEDVSHWQPHLIYGFPYFAYSVDRLILAR